MRKKRTCNGCRVLWWIPGKYYCELGYKVETKLWDDVEVGAIPCEPCPKPRTYEELFEARRYARKKRKSE